MLFSLLIIFIITISLFYCIKSIQRNLIYNIDIKETNNIYEPWKSKMDVSLISQLPELKNGCEVTSLAMLLKYKDINIDKLTLASYMKKDKTNIYFDDTGDIKLWGNPEYGFVGDVTGKNNMGYAINPKPLSELIQIYYSKGALDLTGCSLDKLESILASDRPIVVWVTSRFRENIEWVNWNDINGNKINATFSTHAVTLTGFDENYIYYNDPLTNEKDKKITKKKFLNIWIMMGRKALTVN